MQYPHEREERKLLLGSMIDNSRSYRSFLGASACSIGLVTILAGLINSFWIVGFQSVAVWLSTWIVTLFIGLASIVAWLIFFSLKTKQVEKTESNPQSNVKLFNVRQRFILKLMLPSLLISAVAGVVLSAGRPEQLVVSAAVWLIGYSISLFNLQAFAEPSLKNLGLGISIFTLSTLVVIARHSTPDLNLFHLANILLVVGFGLSHCIYGMWLLLFKNR